MARPLRCRLGIHRWVVHREPGIEPHHECARCQKVMINKPEMIGGQGMGGLF